MRISIDTETDQFEDAVRALYAAFGYEFDEGESAEEDEDAGGSADTSAILPGGWTDKKLRRWAELLTEDAQEIVRYTAAHAPEVGWDEVAAHLGKAKGLSGPVAGNVLGGAMSSGGHARKKLRGAPKDQPLDRDYGRRVYIIDERIAEILGDALGDPKAV